MKSIEENNQVRLRHMLDAAHRVIAFCQGESRESLEKDEKLQYALVKAIEIIGEAATQITPEFQVTTPQIPWPAIKGMRNRLIHAYFDIDLDILWNTATEAIPPLISELEKLISSEDASEDEK